MTLDQSWYALYVRPRAERAVTRMLEEKGYELFFPTYLSKRRWADRVKQLDLPLFPGYVFCRVTPISSGRIVSTPGVIRFVGTRTAPLPVDAAEIDALRIAVRTRSAMQPWPFLKIGQKVRIEAGPLSGLSGLLLRLAGQDRLVLSVSLLQRSVAVEIDGSSVSAA